MCISLLHLTQEKVYFRMDIPVKNRWGCTILSQRRIAPRVQEVQAEYVYSILGHSQVKPKASRTFPRNWTRSQIPLLEFQMIVPG